MNTISLITLSGSIIIFLTSFKKDRDIFSPGRFWLMLWLVVIGITNLKLSYYQNEWPLYTWIILLSGLGAYLLAVYCVNIQYYSVKMLSLDSLFKSYAIDKKRFERIILILVVIYAIAFVLEVSIVGFIPIFTDNPSTMRLEFNIFGIHLIVNSVLTIVILLIEYFIFCKPTFRKKVFFGTILLLLLVSYFVLMNRLYYLLFILVFLMLSNYGNKKVSLYKTMSFMGGFIILFLVIGFFRSVQYAENFLYIVSDMKISKDYAMIAGPYMYISMNLENLNIGIEKLTQFSWGLFSFDPLLAIMQVQDSLNQWVTHRTAFQASPAFTTFPYLWYLYRDFGYGGVVFFSFLSGTVIATIYWKFRTNPSLRLVALYTLLTTGVMLSFFTNMFSRLNFVFNVILLLFIHAILENNRWRAE